MRKVAPDGSVLLTLSGFGQPIDVDFDTTGRAHVANFNTGEVRIYDSAGTFVETLDLARAINLLEIGDDGRLYVSDSSNDRVLVLAPRGGPPDPDVDDDGVANGIDTGNGSFSDGDGTSGQVQQPVPAGLTVLVEDIAPAGVRISVTGSASAKATFTVCGYPGTLALAAGGVIELTCGSVLVRVAHGVAEFTLNAGATIVSVPAGVTAKLDQTATGALTLQNQGGGSVTIVTAGITTAIQAGTTGDVLSPAGVCALTRQNVQSSAKWQAAPPAQRAPATALVTTACNALERMTPTAKPAAKQVLVTRYEASVDALRLAGWLTTQQAAALKNLADTL